MHVYLGIVELSRNRERDQTEVSAEARLEKTRVDASECHARTQPYTHYLALPTKVQECTLSL